MILLRLIDPIAAGGSSRLGAIVQRGIRFIRQVLHGERKKKKQQQLALALQAEQNLVKFCRRPLPAARDRVVSAVRSGVHEVLSSHVARGRIQNLASELRHRYAIRVMSGPVRLGHGLRNRIAIYSFVGLSFGGAVGNRFAPKGGAMQDDYELRVIQELFGGKRPAEQFVSSDCQEVIEEEAVSDQWSISGESDFTVLDGNESDFEILESAEVCVIATDNESFGVSDPIDEVTELTELINLENPQHIDLTGLTRKLYEENKTLKEFVSAQVHKENLLSAELVSVLETANNQQRELLMLREVVQRQNLMLKSALNRPKRSPPKSNQFKADGENPWSSWDVLDLAHESRFFGTSDSGSFADDPEKLRASGGRTRALKVHRKQRLKNN